MEPPPAVFQKRRMSRIAKGLVGPLFPTQARAMIAKGGGSDGLTSPASLEGSCAGTLVVLENVLHGCSLPAVSAQ